MMTYSKQSLSLLFATILMFAHAHVAHADTLSVPDAYPTIQGAINASQAGDTILVGPGTYNERINFLGKGITVQSTDGAALTTINGGGVGSVVTFSNKEPRYETFLDGFTITGGNASRGGGIYAINYAYPTIRNSVITGNTAHQGGGIYLYYFALHALENVTISDNSATYGGGIYQFQYCFPALTNVTITRNSASWGGGLHNGYYSAFYISGQSEISKNTATVAGGGVHIDGYSLYSSPGDNNVLNITGPTIISENSAPFGGGIYIGEKGGLILTDATVANNTATAGGGIYSTPDLTFARITNSIVHQNSSPPVLEIPASPLPPLSINYSNIEGGVVGGVGNIDADPLFVDLPNGDYHLQAGSPSIGTGTDGLPYGSLRFDMDGHPRPLGGGWDMGADEFEVPTDSDGDGYWLELNDCDDADPFSYPGAPEVIGDGIDQDCDGSDITDNDGDGYYAEDNDCDDADPFSYPGAPEVNGDGIDQDCNGYDLTINITKASYGVKKDIFTVEATSSLPYYQARLELIGYGPMEWESNKGKWRLNFEPHGGDPGSFVEICGVEGCETAPIVRED